MTNILGSLTKSNHLPKAFIHFPAPYSKIQQTFGGMKVNMSEFISLRIYKPSDF